MIKDGLTYDNFDDFEINDPLSASEIFRNFKNKTKDFDIPDMYNRLSKECKNVVNHTVICLLPEDRGQLNLGGYLNELMRYREISKPELINLLTVKRDCDSKNGIENDYLGRDDIKSRLDSFLKVIESQERSNEILMEIASLLNVDFDALTKGIGFEYLIDYESLNNILSDRNIDADKFVKQFFTEYVKCYHCIYSNSCKFKKLFFKYVDYNVKAKVEYICKMLNIEPDEILIEKRICIDLEEFPFEKHYKRLLKAERKVIDQIIIDLQSFNKVQDTNLSSIV